MRFETNESANDRWGRGALAEALFVAGGKRVRLRSLYGQPNLPHVVTFAADSDALADAIVEAAYARLHKAGEPSLPAIYAKQYKRSGEL